MDISNCGNAFTPNINITQHGHSSELVETFMEFFVERKHLDLVFICRGNIMVHTHKLVFASVSEFLRDVIEQAGQDVAIISLPDVDHRALRKFTNFLYEGVMKTDFTELALFRDLKSLLGIKMHNTEVELPEQFSCISAAENIEDRPLNEHFRKTKPEFKNESIPVKKKHTCSIALEETEETGIDQNNVTQFKATCRDNVKFSDENVTVLESCYIKQQYYSTKTRQKSTEELQVPSKSINYWFDNSKRKGNDIFDLLNMREARNKYISLRSSHKTYESRISDIHQYLEQFFEGNQNPSSAQYTELQRKLGLPWSYIYDWFSEKRIADSNMQNMKNQTSIRGRQKKYLEKIYNEKIYPDAQTFRRLSKSTGLSVMSVRNWFRYRRLEDSADLLNNITEHKNKNMSLRSDHKIHENRISNIHTYLEQFFEENKNPSSAQYRELQRKLGLPWCYIYDWFCEKRRADADAVNMTNKTRINRRQKRYLEKFYNEKMYPDPQTFQTLSINTGLSVVSVKNWFKYRRFEDSTVHIPKSKCKRRKLYNCEIKDKEDHIDQCNVQLEEIMDM